MPPKLIDWKVDRYGPLVALSQEDQSFLAVKFNLEASSVAALSTDLAYALHPDRFVPSLSDFVNRKHKGALGLERVITDLKMAEFKLKAAQQRLAGLRITYPKRKNPLDDPQEVYMLMLVEALGIV